MKKWMTALAVLLLLPVTTKALDFRSTAITWTFDTITTVTTAGEAQNLGGIFYTGGSGSSVKRLSTEMSGTFSDGTPWKTSRALALTGNSLKETLLDGKRRMAGGYNSSYRRCLAFNASVPGTCYVVLQCTKSVSDAARQFCLYHQYAGFEGGWTHASATVPATNQLTEVKLESTSPGTFWFCANQTANIYAVRFVPNGKDELHIVNTAQQPESMKQLGDGTWLADFGRAAFGQIEVTLTTDAENDTAIVHLGECMKSGRIDREPGGTRRYQAIAIPLQTGTHTYRPVIPADATNTGGTAVHMPIEIGEVTPFRYVEVEGGSSTVDDISRLSVNYRFNDEAASFQCNNATLNKVWDFCKYSIKATSFMGYYIDGDRERTPYEADAYINQLGHFATDAEYTMSRRTLDWLMRNPTWPTEWHLQMPLLAWHDYLWTGDDSFLREHADRLMARTLLALRNAETGLVTTTLSEQTTDFLKSIGRSEKIKDIVDWPLKTEGDGFEMKDYNVVVNAYHYMALRRMAQIYAAIGNSEKSEELRVMSEEFAATFNKAFLDTTTGLYIDGIGSTHRSLHGNMFPLAFGLVPDEYLQSVADFVVSRGMACSVYGSQFLLEALYEAGRDGDALRRLTSEQERSWMNMMDEGSTITMEAWGNRFKTNQDWNHAWGAAPANIIPFRLMGIRPTEPGWSRCEIRPQTATLTGADCRVPTIKGPISLSISNSEESYTMQVDIPVGIAADIYIPRPALTDYSVYLDGKETEELTETGGWLKLNQPVTGSHQIVVGSGRTTTVNKLQRQQFQSMQTYNMAGQRAGDSYQGLVVRDGKKLFSK